jgi:tetratricopeptide (TPR) repeat protein
LAKKYSDALYYYNKAIDFNTDCFDFYARRCSCYEKMDFWDEVVNDGKKSISLNPSYAIGNLLLLLLSKLLLLKFRLILVMQLVTYYYC